MITLSGHNMTEGRPTPVSLKSDLFIGQEVNGPLVRSMFRERDKRTYVPKRDPRQCISWNPDVLKVTHKGWEPFHLSGEAEGWNINTPQRGLIWIKGEFRDGFPDKFAAAGWWAINSWGKTNLEGPFRKEIMLERTLPIVQKWTDRMHDEDRTILMEADANNVRWSGHLRGMELLTKRGTLDHMWTSLYGCLRLNKRGVWRGPETGVGPEHKHKSLNASFIRI